MQQGLHSGSSEAHVFKCFDLSNLWHSPRLIPSAIQNGKQISDTPMNNEDPLNNEAFMNAVMQGLGATQTQTAPNNGTMHHNVGAPTGGESAAVDSNLNLIIALMQQFHNRVSQVELWSSFKDKQVSSLQAVALAVRSNFHRLSDKWRELVKQMQETLKNHQNQLNHHESEIIELKKKAQVAAGPLTPEQSSPPSLHQMQQLQIIQLQHDNEALKVRLLDVEAQQQAHIKLLNEEKERREKLEAFAATKAA